MRYLMIILITMLLGACGNKISNLEYAGQKVKQTVSACKESLDNVCPELNKTAGTESGSAEAAKRGNGTSASTSWDTHMMLW